MFTLNLLKDDPFVRKRVSRIRASRRYWESHSDKVKQRRREAQSRNTDYRRKWRLENIYKISVSQYEAMLIAQDGHCLVCPRTEGLHVDHDHKTGTVRGLLCGSHNRVLGLVNDDPAILRALADYLEKK